MALEYGFHRTDKKVDFKETTYEILTKEAEEAICKYLHNKYYKRIIFIGKCLGTYIQSRLINKFSAYEQKHIFLTPWEDCIDGIVKSSSLVIVGSKVPGFKKEHIDKIANIENVNLKIFEGANHDLEKEDYKDSLQILSTVADLVYDFIK